MGSRQPARASVASATSLNQTAKQLLNALGLGEVMSPERARAEGYLTIRQMLELPEFASVREGMIVRSIKREPSRWEWVRLPGAGSPKAYRQKK